MAIEHALAGIVAWQVLLALVAGTFTGFLVGALPGLGPVTGISLLLPLSFFLPPLYAILFYTTLYQAAEYSGSITAIAVSVPGAPNSAATILDGYPMNRGGAPGKAFAYSLWPATVASVVSVAALFVLAGPASAFALSLGPAELAALAVLGLSTIGVLTGASPARGAIAVALGILVGTVGLDPLTNVPRYTLGTPVLDTGLALVPVLVGVFAVPEAIRLLGMGRMGTAGLRGAPSVVGASKVWLSWREFWAVRQATAAGTAIGFFLGVIPGLAGSVPPFVTYNVMKMVSKHPERFGTGIPEGIAAPEATNAAVMHATLIPAFFLGIPGTPTSAVILGAMIIGGLTPGPLLFREHSVLIYSIFIGLGIGTGLMWVVGRATTTLWVRLLRMPPAALGLIVLVLCVVGSFAEQSQPLDVLVLVVMGLVGVIFKRAGYPPAAFIMGYILGPIFEGNFRRGLEITGGSYTAILVTPLVDGILSVAVVIVLLTIGLGMARRRRGRSGRTGEVGDGG